MEKVMIVFDLETTGTNVDEDRIVQIAIYKPDTEEWFHSCVNPGVPIPAEASEIHGLTNEMLKDAPTFGDIAQEVLDFIGDRDLCGFNMISFDLPLLMAELRRAGLELDLFARRMFDAMAIFHHFFKRDLASAVRHYTGEELEDAHDARADVRATWEVFRAQIERHELGKEVDAHELSMGGRVDLAGKLVRNDDGQIVFGFGKHKGELVKANRGYARWMMGADFPAETKRKIREVFNG